ncbi:MAG TPA: nuclear transport factor 2 family protein [Spirochaetota bacterium]|nr:nuclear transport factor 2 family protein [Spirochaetota bacterium]
MNLTEAEKFCHRWLPAWSGNNPEKLISFYSHRSYYSDPVVKCGLNGYDEIFPYFKKLLGYYPHWKWTYKEIFPNDKGFILKWKAVIPAGEIEIIEYGLDIVEIFHKHITRNEVYFDTLNLFKAIRKK